MKNGRSRSGIGAEQVDADQVVLTGGLRFLEWSEAGDRLRRTRMPRPGPIRLQELGDLRVRAPGRNETTRSSMVCPSRCAQVRALHRVPSRPASSNVPAAWRVVRGRAAACRDCHRTLAEKGPCATGEVLPKIVRTMVCAIRPRGAAPGGP